MDIQEQYVWKMFQLISIDICNDLPTYLCIQQPPIRLRSQSEKEKKKRKKPGDLCSYPPSRCIHLNELAFFFLLGYSQIAGMRIVSLVKKVCLWGEEPKENRNRLETGLARPQE